MEKITKLGEIECWTEEFENVMREFLKNTDFLVRKTIDVGCTSLLEIFDKKNN